MNDFERMLTGLLHNPIDRPTIIAVPSLSALSVYFLAYLCTTEVVDVRLAQVSKKGSALILRQKDPTAILHLSDGVHARAQGTPLAYLADVVEYRGDHFEVSDVESRQRQLDMAEVTVAQQQRFAAGLADSVLARNAHTRIKWAIGC